MHLRSVLELIYFISGPVTAVAAIFALGQLRLLKFDTNTRLERAAKERAIEYSSRYLTEYRRLTMYQIDKIKVFPSYKGPGPNQNSEFSKKSLDAKILNAALLRWSDFRWLPAMNELQVIASAFVTGVADEETGFKIIGRTFLGAVESSYDLLCIANDGKSNGYYSSIIQLYKCWKPRSSTAELEVMKQVIEAELAKNVTSENLPPIGSRKIQN
jgi:hypothetical protein